MNRISQILQKVAAAMIMALAIPAQAATFTVTNTNNTGAGSLRQAVTDANASAGADTINFDPALFSTPQTITLASAIVFNSADDTAIAIVGPGANLLTISGNNAIGIFTINAGKTGTISGMTLTLAAASAISNSGTLTATNCAFTSNTGTAGGAISNSATLTIVACTFTNNTAAGGGSTGNGGGAVISSGSTATASIQDSTFNGNTQTAGTGPSGGAIRNRFGTMVISNSTFSNNTSLNGGGAISNSDNLEITGSTFTSNSAGNAGAAKNGGAISNSGALTIASTIITGNSATGNGGGVYSSSGALSITNSTLSNNTANSDSDTTGGGGGLFLTTGSNPIDISGSTINGNTANSGSTSSGNGGGINVNSVSATTTITNSTVSGNSGLNGGGIYASGISATIVNLDSCTVATNIAMGNGGGIVRASSTNPVNLRNTIVADNSASGTSADLSGTVNSNGYNLIENITGATITGDPSTNIVGIDPNLRALADNGGPTQTHALLPGSPAMDKGNSATLTTDQRGLPRLVDAPNIANAADGADIGAVEAQPPVAMNDARSTNEDTAAAISVLANDTDIDNDAVTIADVTQGANGSVVSNGTIVTYTPNANFFGSDSFTYRISDGTFTSNFATVTVTVNPINDPPSFTKGADQTVNEDAGAQTVAGWATNISPGPNESGQTLAFNIVITQTTGGLNFSSGPAIDPSTGALTYTPAADSNGTATISVTLSDNGSNTPPNVNTSAAQVFTITVNAVNDPPTLNAISDPVAFPEDAGQQTVFLSGITVGPANESGQTLSVTASSSNPALIPDPSVTYTSANSTGSLSYTPVANAFGSAIITVTLTDNGGGANSFSRMFTVAVTPVNDAPVITGQMPVSTEFNTPRTIMFSDLQVTDVDNTYPTGFALIAMDGTNYTHSGNTITPAPNFYGTLIVPVKVSDGALESNTYQLELAVNPDPQDVKSKVRIEKEPGGGYRITFIGNPGQQYLVQFKGTLTDPNWQTLSFKVANPQGSYFIIDTPPAGTPTRFYRGIIP